MSRFRSMVRELEHLADRLPAVLHVMRDCQAGQPQAAVAHREGDDDDRDPRRPLWCWEHERSVADCDEAGLVCTGELRVGPSDPVGSAAIVADRAHRDRTDLLRQLDRVATMGQRVLGVAAGYPTQAAEREQLEDDDEVGTVWCRSCHKDRKRCEPVAVKKDTEVPYYRGLCLWCGRMRKTLAGDRLGAMNPLGDPPTWMVAKHHQGERITPGDVDRARKSIDSRAASSSKAKARGKRR